MNNHYIYFPHRLPFYDYYQLKAFAKEKAAIEYLSKWPCVKGKYYNMIGREAHYNDSVVRVPNPIYIFDDCRESNIDVANFFLKEDALIFAHLVYSADKETGNIPVLFSPGDKLDHIYNRGFGLLGLEAISALFEIYKKNKIIDEPNLKELNKLKLIDSDVNITAVGRKIVEFYVAKIILSGGAHLIL